MKMIIKAAIIAAALGASAAASADTFDFSYTFSDGQQVTGTFLGTTTNGGQSATNISGLQVAFNDLAFSGGASPTLILNSWNTSTEAFTSPSASTTIYANGALNNFGISDADQSVNSNPGYFFNFVNDPHPAVGTEVLAFNQISGGDSFNPGGPQLDVDTAITQWTLNDVSPVPLPAALPLLLSGLGLFGFSRRRAA
jgi:hypothetical protein